METRVVRVDAEHPDPTALKRAVSVLEKGGVVGVPTETVYGLAVHPSSPEAIRRLRELKGDRGEKPFSYHIGVETELAGLGVEMPELGRRLAKRYWPGPLTLVVPRGANEQIGIRMVGHAIARDLIQLARSPLFMTSANRSDELPAHDAESVQKAFDGMIDLILDAGPAQLRSSSTVVRVTPLRWEILREGFLTREMIVQTVDRFVLFVCSGNTCRSPMAKALSRLELARRAGIPLEHSEEGGTRFDSAGVYAGGSDGASPHARAAVAELGAFLDDHHSQPLTPELTAQADEIYTMSKVHLAFVQELLPPEQRSKVMLLDPEGREIPDPFGGDIETYRRTAHHLQSLVHRVVTQDEQENV